MRYSVGYNKGSDASWWLYANNNELVAWAGESFASLFNARRAAAEFKAGASTARFEVYLDVAGKYRWRAWRGSRKVAASGQSFASHDGAQRAADNVRRNGGAASLAAA